MSSCSRFVDELEWKKYLDKAVSEYNSLSWHDSEKLDGLDIMLAFAPRDMNVKKYESEVAFCRGLARGESVEDLRGAYLMGLSEKN